MWGDVMLKNEEQMDISAEDANVSELGRLIKTSIAGQSLSIRKLSKLTGISSSTLSRIINNKQAANMSHMKKISSKLGIPIEQLLLTVGIGDSKQVSHDSYLILTMIRDILKAFEIDIDTITGDIKKELHKFEKYAKTEEGKKLICNDFKSKVDSSNGEGLIIEQLNLLYQRFCREDIDKDEQAVIGSALLYFILSADVIPDYVFPIGYIDDAIAVNLVARRLTLS